MVTCSQRPHLIFAPIFSPFAHPAGVGAFNPALLLGMFQVTFSSKALFQGPPDPILHDFIQFARLELDAAPRSDTARAIGVKRGSQITQIAINLSPPQMRS